MASSNSCHIKPYWRLIALTWLAWVGPNALGSSRLDGVINTYRALQITAFAILASGLIDIVISLDFAETGGVYSGGIVAFGNVLALLILGAAATVAGTSQPSSEEEGADAAASVSLPSEEDAQIAASLDTLIQSRTLYRDVDLNLNRLARKMGLSVRQVSTAVNRAKAMSVSQYVNDFRVREASRLLTDTNEPIARIMFDAGFQAKSNFNRAIFGCRSDRGPGGPPRGLARLVVAQQFASPDIIELARHLECRIAQ